MVVIFGAANTPSRPEHGGGHRSKAAVHPAASLKFTFEIELMGVARQYVGVKHKIFLLLLGVLTGGMWQISSAQGTAFMYQGELADGVGPANGAYDLRFTLYDSVTNGNVVGFPQTNAAVAVSTGLFTQVLDFGAVFSGTNYWLSIGVRTNTSTNAFTVLTPRQALLPVPYAVFANSASNLLGKLATAQLAGTLSSTQLAGTYSTPVSFTNTGNVFAGTFNGTLAGNGAAITNLNGAAVAFGTVADARLTTNVALLNTNQTFTGVNTFSNWTNSFTGSFFGNGLVGWIPVSSTATQAVRDTGYLLLSSNLATVTLPVDANLMVGDIVRISGGGAGGWRVPQISGQSILGSFSGYAAASWLLSTAISSSWAAIGSSADGSMMAAASLSSSTISTSTDYGHSWVQSGSVSAVWRSVAVAGDGSRLLAGQGTAGGFIYYSTNGGSTWTGGGSTGNWYSIAMSANGNNAVAAAYGGAIYTSTNGGVSWVARTVNANWLSVASSTSGANLIAAINGGQLYTSTNFGATWIAQAGSPVASWASVASSADGSKLAAVVYGGKIYTSSDFGVSWVLQSGAVTANWQGIISSADGAKLAAAAYGGGIYVSSDFGVTWSQQSAPVKPWGPISGSADGNRLVAGVYSASAGGIYFSAATAQPSTTVGTNGYIAGPQGSAVELQYIGNNRWLRVSSSGSIGAN